MRKSIIIDVERVGPVLFESSKRAKHLNISVMPSRGVRVAVPYGISLEKAIRFIRSKINWIQKSLDKMEQAKRKLGTFYINFIDIDRTSARNKLITRLNELSEKHGFKYNRVFIRDQKTVWGSCSNKNNINLNIKLICLPRQIMDYVILHELVHTRIKSHSQDFWAELDRFVGNAKKKSTLLRKYGLGLL
jgi:predicted metal-dependent hydrolase